MCICVIHNTANVQKFLLLSYLHHGDMCICMTHTIHLAAALLHLEEAPGIRTCHGVQTADPSPPQAAGAARRLFRRALLSCNFLCSVRVQHSTHISVSLKAPYAKASALIADTSAFIFVRIIYYMRYTIMITACTGRSRIFRPLVSSGVYQRCREK